MTDSGEIHHHHMRFCWHIAKTTTAKHAARAVLTAIFSAKERSAPLVAVHHATLGVWAGKDRKEIKRAIKALVDLGVLRLYGERKVGRGAANVYEILDVTGEVPEWDLIKGGVCSPPYWKGLGKGGGKPHKRGGNSSKKGGTYPPQIKREKKEEGASAHKDAARRGGVDKVRAEGGGDLQAVQRLMELMNEGNDYGTARRLLEDEKQGGATAPA